MVRRSPPGALARVHRRRCSGPLPWPLPVLLALVLAGAGCPTTDDDDDDTTAGDDDAGDDDDSAAAQPVISVEEPAAGADFDECAQICLSAVIELEGAPLPNLEAAVEVDGVGVLGEGTTDEDGRFRVCVMGMAAGARTAAYTFGWPPDKIRDTVEFQVHPFGYEQGLDKPLEAFEALPWLPVAVKDGANPLLAVGAPGEWDEAGVLLPSVVEAGGTYYLYYAGTQTGDYEIGVATSADGATWVRSPANPIVPLTGQPGSWKRWATNSPTALVEPGVFHLWYSGRAEELSDIAIGYAHSADGITFTDYASNPVFQAAPDGSEGSSVSHPSVVRRDEGFYEMWYSTASHDIRYALSSDGVTWSRYCHNPVLEGAGSTWEMGQVKSSEVWFDGEAYWMSYAAGASGDFQVGWAGSPDGLRWVRADQPWIPRGAPGSWEGTSTLGATLLPEGPDLRIWYSGTSIDGGQIGLAEAELAP